MHLRRSPRPAAGTLAAAVALAFALGGCTPTLFQSVLITTVVHSKRQSRPARAAAPEPEQPGQRSIPQVPDGQD